MTPSQYLTPNGVPSTDGTTIATPSEPVKVLEIPDPNKAIHEAIKALPKPIIVKNNSWMSGTAVSTIDASASADLNANASSGTAASEGTIVDGETAASAIANAATYSSTMGQRRLPTKSGYLLQTRTLTPESFKETVFRKIALLQDLTENSSKVEAYQNLIHLCISYHQFNPNSITALFFISVFYNIMGSSKAGEEQQRILQAALTHDRMSAEAHMYASAYYQLMGDAGLSRNHNVMAHSLFARQKTATPPRPPLRGIKIHTLHSGATPNAAASLTGFRKTSMEETAMGAAATQATAAAVAVGTSKTKRPQTPFTPLYHEAASATASETPPTTSGIGFSLPKDASKPAAVRPLIPAATLADITLLTPVLAISSGDLPGVGASREDGVSNVGIAAYVSITPVVPFVAQPEPASNLRSGMATVAVTLSAATPVTPLTSSYAAISRAPSRLNPSAFERARTGAKAAAEATATATMGSAAAGGTNTELHFRPLTPRPVDLAPNVAGNAGNGAVGNAGNGDDPTDCCHGKCIIG